MHRRPVAATVLVWTTSEGTVQSEVIVVCNDGATFGIADGDAAWYELTPVPGTERVAVKKAEEDNPRPRKAPN